MPNCRRSLLVCDLGRPFFKTKGTKPTTDRENVLVIGESYDNAILKLLASHFGRTYSVDLRYYRNYLGSDFSLSDYLRRNSITKVLLIGNVDYYISPDFALEN